MTDFTMVQPGSMHRANGGFIVVQAERLLADMVAYDSLKRTIQTRKLAIEDATDRYTYIVTKSLRPEPIPFNCKVILFGNPESYQILYHYDPDFRELFKVKAEFDRVLDRNDVNIKRYSAFVCILCNPGRHCSTWTAAAWGRSSSTAPASPTTRTSYRRIFRT